MMQDHIHENPLGCNQCHYPIINISLPTASTCLTLQSHNCHMVVVVILWGSVEHVLPTGTGSKLQVGGTVSADLYICETTDGVKYYNECHVSFKLSFLVGALYQSYRYVRQYTGRSRELMTFSCYLSLYCRWCTVTTVRPWVKPFCFRRLAIRTTTLSLCVELFLVNYHIVHWC